MRVAHVSPSFYPAVGYGGPIEASYQLCRWLARAGAQVRVLTTDANGLEARLEESSGREVELDEGLGVRYCRRFARHSVAPHLLRALPSYVRWADVVHLTAIYSFPTIPTLAACRAFGKPLVWSPRGALQRWDRSRRVWAKALWETVCGAIAPERVIFHATSEEEARETENRFWGARACVVPNGVTVPEELRHVASSGRLRLLYFGRLDPIKGLENLLEACAIAQREGGDRLHLTIAGDGDARYVSTLRRRITDLGISGAVSMNGWVDNPAKRRLFEHTDVMVVPSYKESFAIVVAEALSYGVPVIASRGTPWEQIEEVDCGLWIANDPVSLASAIDRVRTMPLKEMGERGRAWVAKEFDWSQIARRMLDIYCQLAGERDGARNPRGWRR